MPKAIERPIPSSSVAWLFDCGAAARAIAEPKATVLPVVEIPPVPPPVPSLSFSVPVRQSTLVKRELVLTAQTDEIFTQLVTALRQATGTRLNASHAARALLRAVAGAIPKIVSQETPTRPLRLPAKARGQETQREAFEQQLADLIAESFKTK
ncbi:MAG: hypothetical protein ABSH20_28910 [Tepidisphaeraceae bacterium]|jgi:hypothetical protein